MATQIIIVLCEGPHDVAFICRILKCNGFVSNEKLKIYEFPQPMNKLMEQEILRTEVQELNLQQVRQNLLPLNTLQKGDNYVFLYSIGGDGKKNLRQNILRKVRINIPAQGEIIQDRLPDGTQLSIVYFFDADNKGVIARLAEVNTEVREVLTTMPVEALAYNGSYGIYEEIKVGAYIFTGEDNNLGKLEDILIPLMQAGNELIFTNTETYFGINHDPVRIFPLKLSIDVETAAISELRSTKRSDVDFDHKKSIIGITGQLQRSGKPNTAYINETDYLTLDKINRSIKCQEISIFFDNFINNLLF